MNVVRPADAARYIAECAKGRRLLLLSDFDGTLCEFEPSPETVELKPGRRDALARLAATGRATVGLVSGRRLEDIRRRAGLAFDAWYAGLHGLEIQGFGERFLHERAEEAKGLLGLIARALARHVADLPGVHIENKGYSIVLHFRQAHPDDKIKADAEFLRMALPHVDDGTLRLMPGSNVSELLPNIPWTKGDAVRWIRDVETARMGTEPFTVYIGDDVTDEDGFQAVGDAASIIVGPKPSHVPRRLADPAAVEEWIKELAARV